MNRLASTVTALVLGILLAGGHVALLQTVAWASMLASRTATGSFATAVETTFDGLHPCALCTAIAQHEHATGTLAPGPKPIPAMKPMKAECIVAYAIFSPPERTLLSRLGAAGRLAHEPDDDAPPLPPPRS